ERFGSARPGADDGGSAYRIVLGRAALGFRRCGHNKCRRRQEDREKRGAVGAQDIRFVQAQSHQGAADLSKGLVCPFFFSVAR
ncbi:hypothetical protein ABTL82_19670, partial [Acinetobacter baumannii]